MKRIATVAVVLMAVVALIAVPAMAGLASGKVKAPATDVEVEILGSNSDFVNEIWLVSPGPDMFIATDDGTGTVVPLPPVRRNQELVFEIRVFEADGVTPVGTVWQSGPPSRNADRERHVVLTATADGIQVAFEDKPSSEWGAPDEPNFVDAVFEVRPAP